MLLLLCLWLIAVESVACDVVWLRLLLFCLHFRLNRHWLANLLWFTVLCEDLKIKDYEDVLVFDEVRLELLQTADAALLQLALVNNIVELYTCSLAYCTCDGQAIELTLPKHALHEVQAVIHNHTESLYAILAGHRFDPTYHKHNEKQQQVIAN